MCKAQHSCQGIIQLFCCEQLHEVMINTRTVYTVVVGGRNSLIMAHFSQILPTTC